MVLACCLAACGDRAAGPPPGEPGWLDCAEFAVPERPAREPCAEPSADAPAELAVCRQGSGHTGLWTVDADGLPAYEFLVDQRCDPAARSWSPQRTPLRDPIHVVGNGRGLVAMAHASGAVEVYSQDRGHAWLNRLDTRVDEQDPGYPRQVAGGFSYYAIEDGGSEPRVHSTRFEDLPVGRAADAQRRRFGVGYFETITRDGSLDIRRRVLAPQADVRALVAEVTIENHGRRPVRLGLTELWDVNLYQLPVELLTSDLLRPGLTEEIDRRRRALAARFSQTASYEAGERLAVVETRAEALPSGVRDRRDVAEVDWFPAPIFLAALDDGPAPDAVWLADDELWEGTERAPPAAAGRPGDAGSRRIELAGAGQKAILALRVPVEVPAGRTTTRRFAFGYAPGGTSPGTAVAGLRAAAEEPGAAATAAWRERLVWAAFPGLPDAAVLQRELAWASYSALALSTFDEYRALRLLGQGGAYKYVHGLDGAMGDLALFAEAIALVDPSLARDTLAYALATQQGSTSATPWRYPYATTGVGAFSDVGIYTQRSDAYWFLPAAIARYVALSRDLDFLADPVAYWPTAAGETGSVVDHVRRGIEYATQSLGFGARGLLAIGTGDYADGITNLATEPATPRGTSSTYNAGAVVLGLPLAADLVEPHDPELAAQMRRLVASQVQALNGEAWQGRYFLRGFVDSGNPLAPQVFFLEPQVLPVLAGIVDDARRDLALDEVTARLETPVGALSNVAIGASVPVGGIDQPLVGGIWPVANAWLTAAYARRDARQAWSSFARNTLAAHAEQYPDLWYGIWTGPDSFNGPDHERPGEADAHLASALTDYPALNAHVHTGPLRALVDLVGVQGTRDGLRIAPRIPSDAFHVRWPRLAVRYTPDEASGWLAASSDGPVAMEVALPARLRGAALPRVEVEGRPVESSRDGALVRFVLHGQPDVRVAWRVVP